MSLESFLAKKRAAQEKKVAPEKESSPTPEKVLPTVPEKPAEQPGERKSFAEILEARRKAKAAAHLNNEEENTKFKNLQEAIHGDSVSKSEVTFDMLNEKQREAVSLAEKFQPFILTGPAGSGKTTTQQMVIKKLMQTGKIRTLRGGQSTKWLQAGSPALAVVSFTNVAVKNIAEVVPEEVKAHCITIHKLLEFAPVWDEEEIQTNDGDWITKKIMRFEPGRNEQNPLSGLQMVIIEEASNVGTRLFEQLVNACPSDCLFIFLGDINQLKPVSDDGILGFKMLELPIVELTEVHRQAKESKILSFAHKVLSGTPPLKSSDLVDEFKKEGELEFIRFKKRMEAEELMPVLGTAFERLVYEDRFMPGRDIILCPFAKGGSINTNEINRHIAHAFAKKNDWTIYEILAGRNTWYLAVGDTVYYNKSSWVIEDIEKNNQYAGRPTLIPSKTLDRWGRDPNAEQEDFAMFLDPVPEDERMAELSAEEKVNQSSHIVYLRSIDDPAVLQEIHTAGDFGEGIFSFGYSLTVHKAQGSEWQNVTLVLHHEHSVATSRELLYTAVTRARKKLVIMFDDGKTSMDPNSILRQGIIRAQIKGNTLADKIAYFTGKIESKARAQKIREQLAEARAEKETLELSKREQDVKNIFGGSSLEDDIPF